MDEKDRAAQWVAASLFVASEKSLVKSKSSVADVRVSETLQRAISILWRPMSENQLPPQKTCLGRRVKDLCDFEAGNAEIRSM